MKNKDNVQIKNKEIRKMLYDRYDCGLAEDERLEELCKFRYVDKVEAQAYNEIVIQTMLAKGNIHKVKVNENKIRRLNNK